MNDFLKFNSDSWAFVFKLEDNVIDHLWSMIDRAGDDHRNQLVGNISTSLSLEDDSNCILMNVLRPCWESEHNDDIRSVIERLYKPLLDARKFNLQPRLRDIWVNKQKKYEYNPLHDHTGMLSFVIWMKIPYDLEKERELEFVKHSNSQDFVGNYQFYFIGDHGIKYHTIQMNKDIEGCCALFPAYLKHQVYPFYTSDEERISIAGNIVFDLPPISLPQPQS